MTSTNVHSFGAPGRGVIALERAATEARLDESRQFVERALWDFGLVEAFESRLPLERERCLRWIAGAAGEREEEARVSRLLDDLSRDRALPP